LSTTLARVGVVAAALLLGWLSIAVTLANATAANAPSLALRLWPDHAAAEARLADTMIAATPQTASAEQRAQIARAALEAARALRRNPTLPGAARILAMEAAMRGDERQSDRLLEYSARMSRRDIPTQFWLLEKRVQANDVGGALSHFGIALQVAPSTREVLFPVLSSALSQRHLRRPIAELAHRGDSWRSDFLYYTGANADPASAGSLFLTLAALGTPPSADHLSGLIERLVNAGNFAGAARLYALADRGWRLGDPAAQLDGAFARTGDLPPFGWELNQNVAWRGPRPDQSGNNALLINLPESGEDWAARKLLLLSPGDYRLAGGYGVFEGSPGRLRVDLACSRGGTVVATLGSGTGRGAGALEGTLRIPAGCTQQWLTIEAAGADGGASGKMWLDDLRLARAGR
jgi:hypothetical protein